MSNTALSLVQSNKFDKLSTKKKKSYFSGLLLEVNEAMVECNETEKACKKTAKRLKIELANHSFGQKITANNVKRSDARKRLATLAIERNLVIKMMVDMGIASKDLIEELKRVEIDNSDYSEEDNY